MKNKTEDLHNHLFATIEALQDNVSNYKTLIYEFRDYALGVLYHTGEMIECKKISKETLVILEKIDKLEDVEYENQ